MAVKSKGHEFRFTFKVFFRLVLFIIFVYFSINYLSSNNSELKINIPFPNLLQYLPPKSQQVLGQTTEYLQSSAINDKVSQAQRYILEFPQKHLNQLKVDIINTVAKELIKRIDTN